MAVDVRYRNFFIPRVEKNLKISPWDEKLTSRGPTALGRTRFFALGLIFEDFSTLGMKKFPYLKTGPFGNPIFSDSIYQDLNLQKLKINTPLIGRISIKTVCSWSPKPSY